MLGANGVEQPYVSGIMVTTDQMIGAAGYLSREWGDHGYRIGTHARTDGGVVFGCSAGDGSEFFLLSDRYGSVRQVEWDGVKWADYVSPYARS